MAGVGVTVGAVAVSMVAVDITAVADLPVAEHTVAFAAAMRAGLMHTPEHRVADIAVAAMLAVGSPVADTLAEVSRAAAMPVVVAATAVADTGKS